MELVIKLSGPYGGSAFVRIQNFILTCNMSSALSFAISGGVNRVFSSSSRRSFDPGSSFPDPLAGFGRSAGADEVSDIVILMFSAKTKSVKQKDDKVTKVDQTKKSVDVEQTEASTEGETQISSETTETNVTTTGGNTVSSSEVITYEVTDIYNESIEAGLVEILNTAGFELIDGGDLDLEEQIETMKIDYGEQGKLSKAVQKSIKQNIASEEISFYVQGIFKIGSQEVDSATGMKMVNVSVVSAKMMHKREGKKFWKTVATVAGNQRKGKGTTYDEAINNAIRLCAQSVAKQMVQKLNAKGIK